MNNPRTNNDYLFILDVCRKPHPRPHLLYILFYTQQQEEDNFLLMFPLFRIDKTRSCELIVNFKISGRFFSFMINIADKRATIR